MSNTNTHLVKSAQRVLEVLEYFNEDRPAATVTDIARALSYPQSSTSVLLRCLRQLGYLYFDRARRSYRPTARAALLGCWAEGGNFRGGKVLDLVDLVGARTGQTVLLSSGGADYMVHHLHARRGSSADAVEAGAGGIEPLLCSARGQLILASYPEKQIRLALHRLNAEEEDAERRVNINEKVADFEVMRERGWQICEGTDDGTPGTVAVLVPRRRGGDRLVLSIVAESSAVAAKGEAFLQVILEERDRIFGTNYDCAAAPGDRSTEACGWSPIYMGNKIVEGRMDLSRAL